jgi:hypothetical protein
MRSCLCRLSLFADLLRLLALGFRSKSALAAENLFLRKHLAFYQEHRIKPRRLDNSTRLALVWLSRWVRLAKRIDGRDAQNLSVGTAQASNSSGAGNPNPAADSAEAPTTDPQNGG